LALIRTAQEANAPVTIVEATVASNDARKKRMASKIIEACDGDVSNKTIGILGLTFKPNTDDMRDSPAIAVAQALDDAGVTVAAYDPEGMELAKPLMPFVEMQPNAYAAIEGADATVIVTEWDAFRALDLTRVRGLMTQPVLVDLRNIYDPAEVRAKGFAYSSVGRP
jgi:UDPglucose 6-dehydrogenase